MRLNGIYACEGTIIGRKHSRGMGPDHLVAVGEGILVDVRRGAKSGRLVLRHITGGDFTAAKNREPRSIAEHENLRRIRTVYGMARTFNPDTKGLGPVQDGSYLDRLRMEKKIKIAKRRNQAELRHLYRLREGK